LQGTRPDERELLHSLRAYLACGRNAKAAARKLQVHRNTLQYRLRRIETLLDRSLDDPDVLFLLELACRILDAQENRR
jgi:purine catabolism regulator